MSQKQYMGEIFWFVVINSLNHESQIKENKKNKICTKKIKIKNKKDY
jgi:hypothetical protein